MKIITMKLKRYKFLCCIMLILFLPIRLPLMFFIWVGEFLENVLNHIDYYLHKIIDKIAEVFKWDEIAKKRYYKN